MINNSLSQKSYFIFLYQKNANNWEYSGRVKYLGAVLVLAGKQGVGVDTKIFCTMDSLGHLG